MAPSTGWLAGWLGERESEGEKILSTCVVPIFKSVHQKFILVGSTVSVIYCVGKVHEKDSKERMEEKRQ